MHLGAIYRVSLVVQTGFQVFPVIFKDARSLAAFLSLPTQHQITTGSTEELLRAGVEGHQDPEPVTPLKVPEWELFRLLLLRSEC